MVYTNRNQVSCFHCNPYMTEDKQIWGGGGGVVKNRPLAEKYTPTDQPKLFIS